MKDFEERITQREGERRRERVECNRRNENI
jgi:hypothetical protein